MFCEWIWPARQALERASLWKPPDIDKASKTMNFVLLVEKNCPSLCHAPVQIKCMICMAVMHDIDLVGTWILKKGIPPDVLIVLLFGFAFMLVCGVKSSWMHRSTFLYIREVCCMFLRLRIWISSSISVSGDYSKWGICSTSVYFGLITGFIKILCFSLHFSCGMTCERSRNLCFALCCTVQQLQSFTSTGLVG